MQRFVNKKNIIWFIIIVVIIASTVFIYDYFNVKNGGTSITKIVNVFPQSADVNTDNDQYIPDDIINDPVDDPFDYNNQQNSKDVFINDIKSRVTILEGNPVSGFMAISTSTVRYVDKATGNVFDINIETKEKTKITSTTLPKTYDVKWVNKNSFVARYLASDNETVKSVLGRITGEGSNSKLDIEFLDDNIKSVDASPNRGRFVYVSTPNKNTYIEEYYLDSNETATLAVFPVGEIKVFYYGDEIYMLPNESNSLNGTLFHVKRNGEIEHINGPVAGLSVRGVGQYLIETSFGTKYTSSLGGNYGNNELGYAVIPEKCASVKLDIYCFMPLNIPSGLPDNWYTGEISMNDIMYKLSLNDLNKKVPDLDFGILNYEIDAISPQISTDEKNIFFINKKDFTLWSVSLF